MQLFTDHAGVTQGKGGVGGGAQGVAACHKAGICTILEHGSVLLHHIPQQHEYFCTRQPLTAT